MRQSCFRNGSGNLICHSQSDTNARPHFGTDAGEIDGPTQESYLYALHSDGSTALLFPYNISRDNEAIGVIGSTQGKGVVLEPNMGVDGKRVHFTYCPDRTNIYQYGCDLYELDLTAWIQNSAVDPRTLPLHRMTFQRSGSARFADAINPTFAEDNFYANTADFNMHGIEVHWDHAAKVVDGEPVKMVFVSNRTRSRQSNFGSLLGADNLNLYVGDVDANGRIFNINRFQYYITTAAVSPERLRNGIAFSYMENTFTHNHWGYQKSNTAGEWSPFTGYASDQSNAYHFLTACPTQFNDQTGANDYVVVNSYYRGNNNGFGGLFASMLSAAGTTDNFGRNGKTPQTFGEYLFTLNTEPLQDKHALWSSSAGQWYGKFTTPSCFGPNWVLSSWSDGDSHSNGSIGCPGSGAPCDYSNYGAQIVAIPGTTPVNPLGSSVVRVIADTSGLSANGWRGWALLWPKAAVSEETKWGGVPTTASTRHVHALGKPISQIGSASFDTDVVPANCRVENPYRPSNLGGGSQTNVGNSIFGNVAMMGYVRDLSTAGDKNNPNGTCLKPYLPGMAYGVRILITDNKVDRTAGSLGEWGNVLGRKETKRQLGVARVLGQRNASGELDESWSAMIPANTPFEFHTIDARTGMKLMDVNSWHSLKPAEEKHECGGKCHGHDYRLPPVDFSATVAGQPGYQPVDMYDKTQVLSYDSNCNVVEQELATASEPIPIWADTNRAQVDPRVYNVFPWFVESCGTCHSPGSTTANHTFAVYPADAKRTYQELKGYLNKGAGSIIEQDHGALRTSAFWAAYGMRTDGEADCYAGYNADEQKYFCYRPEHHSPDGNRLFCNGTDPDASIGVYNFGLWIDNNMPMDTNPDSSGLTTEFPVAPYYGDRFHPTVTYALTDRTGCTLSQGLEVGFWDDMGAIASLALSTPSDSQVITQAAAGGPLYNGTYHFAASALNGLTDDDDLLLVVATDATGNQQKYSSTLSELLYECQVADLLPIEKSPPTPTPSPTPDPGFVPTPTPPGGGTGGNQLRSQIEGFMELWNDSKRDFVKEDNQRKRGKTASRLSKQLKQLKSLTDIYLASTESISRKKTGKSLRRALKLIKSDKNILESSNRKQLYRSVTALLKKTFQPILDSLS